MTKKLAIVLAAISIFTFAIPAAAASDVTTTPGIISEDTVVVEETATSRKEVTTTMYSDGSSSVSTLSVTYDNRGRANSGTAYADHSVTFKNQTNSEVRVDMEATFTYDGNAGTVSCIHKSYEATELDWSIYNESISTSSGSKKVSATTKVYIESPSGSLGTLKKMRSVTITCNSVGKVTKASS